MPKVNYQDLGRIDYQKAWDYQEKLFDKNIKSKLQRKSEETENYLLFCEHDNVYTLGKSGAQENMLLSMLQLKSKHASFHKTNRGGDITYHGPGQITGYPILDLEKFGIGVRDYVDKLEQAGINFLADYGIKGERLEGASGVWLDVGKPSVRKICAIGVRVSRWITMHGFAFNVNTDLEYFDYINPCGFVDKGVTSLKKELGKELDFEQIKEKLKNHIAKEFDMTL
ncbi:MAG: lipoyl(octanoyl) transferase LipB [Marinifilaceae bacterium]|jgi:lipoyl(octanoyl) transferase|nr:lipoyl(octanoyl) transferase LipB [Marinifilaceae bacterium]